MKTAGAQRGGLAGQRGQHAAGGGALKVELGDGVGVVAEVEAELGKMGFEPDAVLVARPAIDGRS